MLTIGDTQGFSSIAPITLNRGFNVETLTVIRQKCEQTLGLGLGQLRYCSSNY